MLCVRKRARECVVVRVCERERTCIVCVCERMCLVCESECLLYVVLERERMCVLCEGMCSYVFVFIRIL